MEENKFVCGFLVCGPEEKVLMSLIKMALMQLGTDFQEEEDGIVVFEADVPIKTVNLQKYSTIHPDNLFFYSWANESTFSRGHIVVQNGKILKNTSNIKKI